MTHDLTLPLEPANCGSIHFLLTISGSSIMAEEVMKKGDRQKYSMEEMRNKYVSCQLMAVWPPDSDYQMTSGH